jgi:3-dehydroquinate synthase
MSDYKIPHGQAVVAGIIVVNELSYRRGLLGKRQKSELLPFLFDLLDLNLFKCMRFDNFETLLRNDKKNTRNIVNLVIINSIGRMRFLPLNIEISLLNEILWVIKSQFIRK